MTFTGGILFFLPIEPALKVEGQGETGRERRMAKAELHCVRERFSGYVFTEMVRKEISTRALSNKS